MPISPGSVPNAQQRAWWLLPELVAFVLLAALLVAGVEVSASPGSGSSLDDQLSARIASTLENASPLQHAEHGHQIAAGVRILCTAEVYGTEPRGAKTLADVRLVYGYYMCASGLPGTPFDYANRSSGPCVLRLSNPPIVQIAQSGQGYDTRVRAMMPDEYEAWSFAGFRNKDLPARLRERYQKLIAEAPSVT